MWISLLSILGSNNFGGFLSEHGWVCLAGEVQLYVAAAACLDGIHSALLDHADGEGVVGGDVLLCLAAGEVQLYTAAVACLGGKHPSLPDDDGGGELGAFILAWAGGRSLLCLLVGVDIQSESLLLLGDWWPSSSLKLHACVLAASVEIAALSSLVYVSWWDSIKVRLVLNLQTKLLVWFFTLQGMRRIGYKMFKPNLGLLIPTPLNQQAGSCIWFKALVVVRLGCQG